MDSEALQEHYEKLADECEANKDQLVFRNFQIRPLHVQTITKVEDVEENLKPSITCCVKIDSRMSDDGTFSVHGFLIEPKFVRKIFESKLQIKRGLERPVQDLLRDMVFTLFIRPSKALLVLDVEPKMSPLLQLPQQIIRRIPSSGSVHQQPNRIADKGEEVMSSEPPSSRPPSPPPPPPPPTPQPSPAARVNIDLSRSGQQTEITEASITSGSEIVEDNQRLMFFPLHPDSFQLLNQSPFEVDCCAAAAEYFIQKCCPSSRRASSRRASSRCCTIL